MRNILLLLLISVSSFGQSKVDELEKRLKAIEAIYMQEIDMLELNCPKPENGATLTTHARHKTLSSDSANFCRLWINDIPVYPTDISAGSGITIGGSYSSGWTISSTHEEQIGVGKIWFTNTAPLGYLICDGSAVSRSTYSDLFAIIGTTYGSGNGSTTFNLPDLRQRFPLGKSASGTGNTLAGTGGAIDHVHSVDPPNTTTSTPSSNTAAATPLLGSVPTTTHTHDVNIPAFNSASANPPYLVVNYIIKY